MGRGGGGKSYWRQIQPKSRENGPFDGDEEAEGALPAGSAASVAPSWTSGAALGSSITTSTSSESFLASVMVFEEK